MNFVVTAYDSLLQSNIIEDTNKGSVTTDPSLFLKNKTCVLSVESSVIIVDGDGQWLNVINGCHI